MAFFQKLVLALMVLGAAPAAAFTTSRWTTPTMGLAVGDKFPAQAAKAWGVSGKKAVVYFYGADGAPSCTKQAKAFDAAALDATVVGVRSDEGVKEGFSDEYGGVKFVVDEGNEVREEVGIAKDLFGFLPGRETYVLDKSGTVVEVFNNQFAPEKHVAVAEAALESIVEPMKPGFKLPDFFNKGE